MGAVQTRRNYLPVVETSRALTRLLALNVGLAERLPGFMWRTTPDPIPACREIDALIEDLDYIIEAATDARARLNAMWEVAASVAQSDRERPDGVDSGRISGQ